MEKIFKFLSVCALAFLVFLVGNIYSLYDTKFIDEFSNTIKYIQAATKQQELSEEYSNLDTKGELEFIISGNITNDEELTLFNTNRADAFLINPKGEIVYKWNLDYKDSGLEVYDDTYQNINFDATHWRYSHLFPNGDLLTLYTNPVTTPYGGGLIKIDKNSNIIWKYEAYTHHAFDIDKENGDIAVISQKLNMEEFSQNYNNTPFLDDSIVILDKDGNFIRENTIVEMFLNSGMKDFLELNIGNRDNDFIHMNSVEIITATQAEKLGIENIEKGDILASVREMDLLLIADKNLKKIKWYKQGIWHRQHDPEITDDGNIVLFDNQGLSQDRSRILEYNPRKDSIDWFYVGGKDSYFHSARYGSVEILKNGNYLVTESDNKRIFELSKDKKIVWKAESIGEGIFRLLEATRYNVKELNFLNDVKK